MIFRFEPIKANLPLRFHSAKPSTPTHVHNKVAVKLKSIRAQRLNQEISVLQFRPHVSNGDRSRCTLPPQGVVVHISMP